MTHRTGLSAIDQVMIILFLLTLITGIYLTIDYRAGEQRAHDSAFNIPSEWDGTYSDPMYRNRPLDEEIK